MAYKLDTSITIRLSVDEKIAWQEKAVFAGIPLSILIREAMSRTRTWTANDRSSIREQTRQISRIGNNLNQIAKWANTYKSTAEAIEIIEALRTIEKALTQLSTNPLSPSPSSPPPEAE
ncbi:MAG: MobC family plasmid mobilization relaxosome protein [Pleurocapsa sp. CRU_1_2]|nr:MobC family plasmid mobilization relaxosome protein [Pleurocapsa sp. CRU_1_2]